MGFDGITVMHATADGAKIELESIAMEFSFRLIELREAASARQLGAVSDITVKMERGTLLVRCLTDEFFVCLFLGDPRHAGKGRWVLRSQANRLAADL